ncbi:MAG: hypothetical protein RL701_7057, partial [Pseudomonadota bacterium]
MRCLKCQAENLESSTVCNACGEALFAVCVRCHAQANTARARFCDQCGSALHAGSASGTAAASLEAERRHLTVLFCDVVGSTSLSHDLDPEDLREIVTGYHARCAEVVSRFEGHIAQYLGDGVLVYFGFPRAHGDDASRAVRAGLGILQELKSLTAAGRPLKLRIGVYTGVVVVGPVGVDQSQRLAVGEAPNLASRVQSRAKPNTLVISETTFRLVSDHFECVELGEHWLRGLPAKERLYRVVAEPSARLRQRSTVNASALPFVGRADETELLLASWERTCRDNGHVVTIRGEPGIGKSRLLQRVKEQVETAGGHVLECRCSPYYQTTALHPIAELLARNLGATDLADAAARHEKIAAELSVLSLSQEAVALLAALGALTADERTRQLQLSAQKLRQRTLEAVVQWLVNLAAEAPTLFIIEDLHWADPTTVELVRLLVQRQPGQLLSCLTTRPEFDGVVNRGRMCIELNLGPLKRDEVTTMIHHLAGERRLSDETIAKVFERTTGIPLFVEEVTKAVLEISGLPPVSAVSERYERQGLQGSDPIPATLRDSLAARLDRLNGSKITAQLAATLGRVFRYDLLRAVSSKDEAALQIDLNSLVAAELIFREGDSARPVYSFKHALIRDAAYDSLLRSTRQDYHRRIAEALLQLSPDAAAIEPEVIATHFEGAGLREEAA